MCLPVTVPVAVRDSQEDEQEDQQEEDGPEHAVHHRRGIRRSPAASDAMAGTTTPPSRLPLPCSSPHLTAIPVASLSAPAPAG